MLPVTLTLALFSIDRVCLSVAMLPLAKEFGWSAPRQGLVQSAFLWGYLVMQLPGGWAADRFGGRRVLMVSTAHFSLSTLLLPLAAASAFARSLGLALPAVVATRVLLGLSGGPAIPSMLSIATSSVPAPRRAEAIGAGYTGFQLGNLLGLVLTGWIIQAFGGWRAPFFAFAAAGALVLAAWAAVPESGRPATSCADEETRPARGGAGAPTPTHHSVASLLRSRAVRTLLYLNAINNWGYFLYLNWMPSFFYRTFGLDLQRSSVLSMLPWALMALVSAVVGRVADWLVTSRGQKVLHVRRGMQCVAFLGPVAAMCLLSALERRLTVPAAAATFIFTLGTTACAQAGFVAAVGDVAPGAAGTVFGLTNCVGCMAGIASTTLMGVVIGRVDRFAPVFLLTAALNVLGVALTLTELRTDLEFP